MRSTPLAAAVLLVACLQSLVSAFYLPGVSPVEYAEGENVTIKTNTMKSTKTAMPYDYYSVMVCPPLGTPDKKGRISVKSDVENFGEILWGDRIKPSRYAAQMKVDVPCTILCTTSPKPNDPKEKEGRALKKLKKRIDNEYRGYLILDNLPVAEKFIWEGGKSKFYYKRGYPLGVPGNATTATLVNNHLALTIVYHRPQGLPGFRIVGFNVVPYSVANDYLTKNCQRSNDLFTPDGAPAQTVIPPGPPAKNQPAPPASQVTQSIVWSYSVKWEEDPEVAWSSRWDHLLSSGDASDEKIHWFSIVNSLLIVLFLSGMVAVIMLRTLHRDFNRYNNPENEDEAQEETGWKLVHADVFREPAKHELLSVYVGTGSQLLGMTLVTLLFALLGFLSPANRGGLLTVMILLFALMGSYGGYVTARFAKMFHAQSWHTVFLTGMWVPGKVFGVFLLLDFVLWGKHASTAVPIGTMFLLLALWLLITIPLIFAGAVLGYRRAAIEPPLGVSQIPRQIPPQRWYLRGPVVILAAGVIPFGAAFMEVYFILSSLWLNKFYYVFGFLALVVVILAVTCAEISVVMTYFQLCYEDYHWWWRGFLTTASSGLHLFLYSLWYLHTNLEITNFWSICLYVGYMSVASYLFGVISGTIGFLASFSFVRAIYAALKVD